MRKNTRKVVVNMAGERKKDRLMLLSMRKSG